MSVGRPIWVIAAGLLLGGCSLIPAYEKPAAPIPQAWPEGPAYASASEGGAETSAGDIGWREFFVDPQLKQLIAQALENNRDARIAALEVERSRARYRIQRADLLPQVDGQGSYTKRQTPSNFSSSDANGVGNGGSTGNIGGGGGGSTFEFYRVGLGLTEYELDLFGRVRSLKQQALQTYLASVEARRSAQISLIAEVANAYFTLLADRALLTAAQDNKGAQTEAVRLVKKRYEVGLSPYFDVQRSQTQDADARADIALYQRRIAQDRNALALLTGAPVTDAMLAGESLQTPKVSALPTAGLSSDLLLRRPDVLAAEHQLKAANANIGAARAAFFPSISLIGNYGTISTDLAGLFEPGSTSWSFTPQISVPIFAGGRNRANLDVAQVSKKIEVARYQKAVQVAFREAADALAGRGTLDEEVAARDELVQVAENIFDSSVKRYFQGIDSYLAVLDAQRTLYDGRQSLINVQLARLGNIVNLYKVLGGGWREPAANQSEPEPAAEREPGAAPAGSAASGGLQFWSRLSSYQSGP